MFNDNFSFTPRDLNVDRLNGGLHSPINDTASEFGQLSPLTRLHSSTSMRSSKSKSSRASSTVSRPFMSSFWRNSRSVLVSPTETECTTNRFSAQDLEFPLPKMTLTVPETESFGSDDGSTNDDMYDQLPGIVSAMEATPVRLHRPGSGNKAEEIFLGPRSTSSNDSASSSSTSTTRSRKNRPPPLTIPTSTQERLLGPQQAARKSHKPPPKLKSPVRASHRRQHSEIADTIGVQLLLDAFDESEDDSPDATPVRSTTPVRNRTPEPIVQTVHFTEPTSLSRRRSSLRPPTIDELDETNASETSSISTYYPTSPSTSPDRRRYSHTSTIPTSVSGQSIVEPSVPPPSLKAKDSFLFDSDRSDSDTCPNPRPLGRHSLARSNSRRRPTTCTSDTESGSRRSSTNTFFCQGRNPLAAPSINRNPSIASSYPFDDAYDETYYAELKAKISRLALKPRQPYSDSDEDDYAYDAPYRRPLSRTSRNNSTSCVQPTDVGAQWKLPAQRRTRRRTASSECVVLDVLESMETAAFELDTEWNDVGWDTDLVMEREESETEDPVSSRKPSLRAYF